MKPRSLWVEWARGTGSAASVSLPFQPAAGTASDVAPAEEEVTRLFNELRAAVLRYLLSMGLPAADGDEVVQEAFLALFHHLRRGRPRTNLRGWVFRTAHNLGLKRRQRIQRSRALAAGDTEGARDAADGRPNPEEQAAARQRQEKMLAIVRALPEQDRLCLNLLAEGLRYREIAEVLGMSLGAVSISIRRSREKLSRVAE